MIEQGTIAWEKARLGRVTGSEVWKIIASGRGSDFTKVGEDYIYTKAAEIITGATTSFSSKSTEWGTMHEAEAKGYYQMSTDDLVTDGDWIAPTRWVGGSPDGYVGHDGIIEIKCPYNTVNHVKAFEGVIKKEYTYQMQMYMWLSERSYCDFISYDPRCPGKWRMHVERVERCEEKIKLIQDRIELAVTKIKEIIV